MKKIHYLILFVLFFGFQANAQFKVIAYLPTWAGFPNSISNVQLSKVTHINVAFANPNTSGVIALADGRTTSHLATVVSTAHAQNVKVFLSIGGAGAPGSTYKTLLSNTTNMNNFVSNLVNYCTNNNLDGIDVDIEGDVLNGSFVTKVQYEAFVTALATALHAKNFKMTAALANWFATYVSNTAAAQFDWINIMSYDNKLPTDPAGEHSTYNLAVSDFTYWKTTKGVPGNKLVIGVPFYGYGWGTYADANEIAYSTIVATYSGAETKDIIGSGSNMISYNGIPTIQQKTSYACAYAAGVMIWQITEDATGTKSLLSAIHDQILTCTTGTEEIVSSNNSGLALYPNPSTEQITLKLNLSSAVNCTISVVNQQGQEVLVLNNVTLGEGNQQYSIDVSALHSGMYFVKVVNQNQNTFSSFIKL